jgi:hypothetical protein
MTQLRSHWLEKPPFFEPGGKRHFLALPQSPSTPACPPLWKIPMQ